MDIKELVKKVVEGGSADEVIKGLDSKQQSDFYVELAKERKASADAELRIIEARRAESGKLKTEIETVQATAEVKVRSQMRGEQIDIAFNRFVQDLASKKIILAPEEVTVLKSDFSKFDTGKFDSTLIQADILSAYAAKNAKRLLDSSILSMSSEQGAAQFNAGSAGAGNTGSGTAPAKEYAPEVIAAVRAGQKFGIQLTPEQAERGLNNSDWKRLDAREEKSKNVRGGFAQIG